MNLKAIFIFGCIFTVIQLTMPFSTTGLTKRTSTRKTTTTTTTRKPTATTTTRPTTTTTRKPTTTTRKSTTTTTRPTTTTTRKSTTTTTTRPSTTTTTARTSTTTSPTRPSTTITTTQGSTTIVSTSTSPTQPSTTITTTQGSTSTSPTRPSTTITATQGSTSTSPTRPPTTTTTTTQGSTRTSSTRPSTTTTTTTTSAPLITTWYSSYLTMISPTFMRPDTSISNYYYESIEIKINLSSYYTLRINSTMKIYVCLYKTSFDSINPDRNKLLCNNVNLIDYQIELNSNLKSDTTYILVVTTINPDILGNYSLSVMGPSSVSIKSITPIETTSTGYLSSNDRTYIRPGCLSSSYYYNEIQLTTNTTDIYIMKSRSLIDTYGCLYMTSFDSSNPSKNMITCDDNTGGNAQFLIKSSLESGQIYILVVTTSIQYTTGNYSILITGPTSINTTFISKNNRSLTLLQIILIVIGCCLIFTSIVVGIFVFKRKYQKTDTNDKNISSYQLYTFKN